MEPIKRIRGLYEDLPQVRQAFKDERPETDISVFFDNMEATPLQDFSFKSMDDYEESVKLSSVLSYLPAEIIHNQLGFDALYWVWINYPFYDTRERFISHIARITNRKKELLEKARLSAWRLLSTSNASTVKAIDDLITHINADALSSIDLATLLKQSVHPGVIISDKRASDYLLTPLNTRETYFHGPESTWSRSVVDEKHFELFLDTPVGVGLLYKGVPNAVLGLIAENPGSLIIYQLQGVQPAILNKEKEVIKRVSSRGLMPLDWQKLMVSCAEELATQLGFKQLGIRGGRNNPWTKKQSYQHIHLPLKRALVVYDETAKRLGFRQEKNRNWYKPLEEG